ncbi:MAG: FG-GAP repeat protein [Sphingomonadaceae bacterium]|nr:FG-GAP repeat protein [Sphingomonadaceae bacterium]
MSRSGLEWNGSDDAFARLPLPQLDTPAVINLSDLDGIVGFRLQGVHSFEASGRSVASAGDVNGDGFADIIIGSPGTASFSVGEGYVVFGKSNAFPASVKLAKLNGDKGFRIDTTGTGGDHIGASVAAAGDINGDGFGDILIGSFSNRCYLVFGKATGFDANLELDALDGSDGFRMQGGNTVSGAGDVNGDGLADIVVGAPHSMTSGVAYVVFGKVGVFDPSVDLSALDGVNGFRIDGVDTGDLAGFAVAAAGDVNGDGFGDIVIGAYHGDPGGDGDAGESYVIFGKAGGFAASLDLESLNGVNGFRIDGIDIDDESGFAVEGAGDINGDGFDDLVIGAPNADSGGGNIAGESYVVFGRASGFAASFDLAALDGSNGFRLEGIDPYDRSGFSVDGAGDFNGDGFDDILIGTRYADAGAIDRAGEAYLLFGRAGGFAPVFSLASLDGSNGIRFAGIDTSDVAGWSVSAAGDINSDGFDDILIGAPGVDRNGNSSVGESYVIFGFQQSGVGDTITGTNGPDSLDGGTGDDSLIGLDGDDTLRGMGGADALDGGSGGDWADYTGAPEKVVADLASPIENRGHALGDTYISIENVRGTALNDTLAGDGGANILDGAERNDILEGRAGADMLFGRAGDDTLEGAGDNDLGDGEEGADVLDGGLGDDTMSGGIDNDRVSGGGGLDIVNGGDGEDSLLGDDGNDTVSGHLGADALFGGNGDDSLIGGNGGDTLAGGAGADILDGRGSIDWADYGDASGAVTADLKASSGNRGEGAGDIYLDIENLRGSGSGDKLRGDNGGNVLDGNSGNDSLTGRDGHDTLVGGIGRDTLEGGSGADMFQLRDLASGGADAIVDFAPGEDVIALKGSVFGITTGALSASNFVVAEQAQDADDLVIYDDVMGRLYYDADGNGFGAQLLIATIDNLAALTAENFAVI